MRKLPELKIWNAVYLVDAEHGVLVHKDDPENWIDVRQLEPAGRGYRLNFDRNTERLTLEETERSKTHLEEVKIPSLESIDPQGFEARQATIRRIEESRSAKSKENNEDLTLPELLIGDDRYTIVDGINFEPKFHGGKAFCLYELECMQAFNFRYLGYYDRGEKQLLRIKSDIQEYPPGDVVAIVIPSARHLDPKAFAERWFRQYDPAKHGQRVSEHRAQMVPLQATPLIRMIQANRMWPDDDQVSGISPDNLSSAPRQQNKNEQSTVPGKREKERIVREVEKKLLRRRTKRR